MSNWKKLLSVLIASLLLLSMPLTSTIARTYAEGAEESAKQEESSERPTAAVEPIDPATLHVQKLGELEKAPDPKDEIDENTIDPNRIVRASVFLESPAALEQSNTKSGNSSRVIAETRRKLMDEQSKMQSRIEKTVGHKLEVKWNLTLAVNAISVEIPFKDVLRIQQIAGVKSVELETQYEAPRDAAADHPNTYYTSDRMVGATAAWGNNYSGYTGYGTRVAIIDTGLDIDHQSVNADAFHQAISEIQALSKYSGKESLLMDANDVSSVLTQLNAYGRIVNPSEASQLYLNEKVPYRFNYVDSNFDVTHLNDTQGEHGSHVAGISAANRYIKNGASYDDAGTTVGAVGMAPDAQLLIMKVFGAKGGAYDSDYMVAIEDAITLGCDVVNLSLGSSVQGWTYSDTYQEKLNSFANQTFNPNMVISISAGNSYALDDLMDGTLSKSGLYIEDIHLHTGGSPGTFVNSLCVAAAQNTTSSGTPLLFDGRTKTIGGETVPDYTFYNESTTGSDGKAYGNAEMATLGSANGTEYGYVYIDAIGSEDDYSKVEIALQSSGATLQNKIIVINRGGVSFAEKGNNAASVNPKAIVVANNAPGSFGMDLTGYSQSYPMVAVTQDEALRIKQERTAAQTADGICYYTGTVKVFDTKKEGQIAREDATITDFSSWGAPGSLLMKPEITAPGGDIYSIFGTNKTSSGTAGGTDQYELMSGTSMAAPHITGLAAVVAQYLRENNGLRMIDGGALYNMELTEKYSIRAINQSLMMSTATPMINKGHSLSILQQGAGLVDVSRAIDAKSVVMMDEDASYLTGATGAAADGKVKVELGDNPTKDLSSPYAFSFNLYNITGSAQEYEFETHLFTQNRVLAVDGWHMMKTTTDIHCTDSIAMYVEGSGAAHDVNQDGVTDDQDAQAILDVLTGEKTYSSFGWATVDAYNAVAEADNQSGITSHDAYALMQGLSTTSATSVPAHGKGRVEVQFTPDADDLGSDLYPNGAYIEGFLYVYRIDGAERVLEHSIPILGFYGSWTDPSMFDAASYVDGLYQPNGVPKTSYTGNQDTNYMTLTINGKSVKFSGNPYMVESEFPTERLAINSSTKINAVYYNLYRGAATTGFAVTKTDAIGGDNTVVLASGITGSEVSSIYYSPSGGWQNTGTKSYSFNKTISDYGTLSEGETIRVGFYAIPEYNAMMQKNSFLDANSGKLSRVEELNALLTNPVRKLGLGAFMGYDFRIDNTAPVITAGSVELDKNNRTLKFDASDNQHLAYLALMSLDGSEVFAEFSPEGTDVSGQSKTYFFENLSDDALNITGGYLALFAADYAGNETAVSVEVNSSGNPLVVYRLLNRYEDLEANKNYLILNKNIAGYAQGLSYVKNGSNVYPYQYSVAIHPATEGVSENVYVLASDVVSNGVWTATHPTATIGHGSDWRFESGGRYISVDSAAGGRHIEIKSVSDTYGYWVWNLNDAYLSNSVLGTTYYLQYVNNAFDTVATQDDATSVYLFVEEAITATTNPSTASGLSITPTSLDLYVRNTEALTASITPITATDRAITWASSNNAIATVSADGVVTAVNSGTALITATLTSTVGSQSPVQASCIVRVKSINKDLYGIVYGENGRVDFKSFNTVNVKSMVDRSEKPDGMGVALANALVYDTQDEFFYATTCDMYGTNASYKVTRNTYALEQTGEPYIATFGLAKGPHSVAFGDMAVFGYAYFLLAGPMDADSDGYTYMPYGILDTSETAMGGAFIAGVCIESYSGLNGGSSSYFVLDETGKIWRTSITKPTGISEISDILVNILTYTFTEPELVIDTGIGTSFMEQSLYYDGNYIYWSHSDGTAAEMIIIEPGAGKIYHAGDFGDDIWPVMGLHVDGAVAPTASVKDEDVPMDHGDAESPESVDPVITREQLMTPEIVARMQAEAKRMQALQDGAEGSHRRSVAIPSGSSTSFTNGELILSESEASTNGMFTADCTSAGVAYVRTAAADTKNLLVSIHENGGTVTVAYAYKSSSAMPAHTPIVKVELNCVSSASVAVATTQRNTSYALTENETISLSGDGHAYGAPTYTWTEGALDNGVPTFTVTASCVCAQDPSHVLTETVTAVCAASASEWVYTATFANAAFAAQTKTVSKLVPVTVTSSGDGTTAPGNTVALVTGGGSFAPGATTNLVAPTVSGYAFLGWYPVNGDLTTDRLSQAQTFTYTVRAANNDLIAVYEPQAGAMFRLTITGTRFTIQENANDTVTTQRSRFDDYYTAGSSVTVTYTGSDNFLYWINSNKKIVCLSPEYTFVLMSNTDIDAVYSEQTPGETTHEALVLFVSAKTNGQVISQRYYTDQESIVYPVAPVRAGKDFVGWDKTEEEIHAAMATETRVLVYPIYQSSGGKYTTVIEYWVGDTYKASIETEPAFIGTTKTISAEATYENESFSYWADEEGNILGYNNQEYVIYPTDDITIKAVYGVACQPQPVVRMTNAYATQNGNDDIVNFTSTWSIGDSYTVTQAGVLYAGLNRISVNEAEECLTLSYFSTGAKKAYILKVEFTGTNPNTAANAYFTTTQPDRQFIARGYVVLENNSTHESIAVYSDNVIYASYNELVNKVYHSVNLDNIQ